MLITQEYLFDTLAYEVVQITQIEMEILALRKKLDPLTSEIDNTDAGM